MNIDIAKKYTTRSGLPVRIYATDGADIAVHGAYKTEAGWEYTGWTEGGSFYEDGETNDLDLVPVKTWRAWKEGEGPEFFMVQRKTTGELSVAEHTQASVTKVWFDHYLWVHEDGTETPCGVEE
jgi:hypothetical protein